MQTILAAFFKALLEFFTDGFARWRAAQVRTEHDEQKVAENRDRMDQAQTDEEIQGANDAMAGRLGRR